MPLGIDLQKTLVSSGDRIAQMILVPIKQAKLRVVEDFQKQIEELKDSAVLEWNELDAFERVYLSSSYAI